jgi:Ulp1 family protease
MRKPRKNFSFILNTQPSTQKIGHWVSVIISPKAIEYFDSFGEDPPPQFLKRLRPILKKSMPSSIWQLKINNVKQQKTTTNTCGYFAMKFLRDRYEGKTWKEASKFKIIEYSIK